MDRSTHCNKKPPSQLGVFRPDFGQERKTDSITRNSFLPSTANENLAADLEENFRATERCATSSAASDQLEWVDGDFLPNTSDVVDEWYALQPP